jgi:hypothetical protein
MVVYSAVSTAVLTTGAGSESLQPGAVTFRPMIPCGSP